MLFIGQDKPWRSFDDMTSNADTLFLERNVLSDKGIYGGREFAQGVFYRMLFAHPLFGHDHLFVGLSGYSLGNTVQANSPEKGVGYNARIAYAPYVEHNRWLHLEASFSSDHSGNGHPLRAYFKGYYGYKGDEQMVVDLTDSSGVNSPRVNTEETEVAAARAELVADPDLVQAGRRGAGGEIVDDQIVEAVHLTRQVELDAAKVRTAGVVGDTTVELALVVGNGGVSIELNAPADIRLELIVVGADVKAPGISRNIRCDGWQREHSAQHADNNAR